MGAPPSCRTKAFEGGTADIHSANRWLQGKEIALQSIRYAINPTTGDHCLLLLYEVNEGVPCRGKPLVLFEAQSAEMLAKAINDWLAKQYKIHVLDVQYAIHPHVGWHYALLWFDQN